MDRIMKVGFGLALGLAVSLGGCVVAPVDGGYLDDYEAPSPYAVPLYGERYRNPDGVMVVYDSGPGAYVVEGHPDVYWRDHHYYRLRDGHWERSSRHFGPWEHRRVEQRPPYPSHPDGHPPRGRGVDPDREHWPRRPPRYDPLPVERLDTDRDHRRPQSGDRELTPWPNWGARPRPEPRALAVGRSEPSPGTDHEARRDWQRQQNAERNGQRMAHREGPPAREETPHADWPWGLPHPDRRQRPERQDRDQEDGPTARSGPGFGGFRPQDQPRRGMISR